MTSHRSGRQTLRARARAAALRLYDRHRETIPVRLIAAFVRIDGRSRVLVLAAQAFMAVIPILIVVATVSGADGSSGVGSWLVDRFDLEGSAEESVRVLFDRPPEATGGLSLVSLAILLFSANSFSRSLQHTFCAAWGLSRRAPLATVHRTAGLAVLLLVLFGASWVGGLLNAEPLPRVLGLGLQFAAIVAGWALASWLLLARRRSLRDLVPGALASALLQLVVGWGTALHLPRLIARNAENYGAIGAALALVSWLIVVAASIVASAVLGRVLGAGDEQVAGSDHGGSTLAPDP